MVRVRKGISASLADITSPNLDKVKWPKDDAWTPVSGDGSGGSGRDGGGGVQRRRSSAG